MEEEESRSGTLWLSLDKAANERDREGLTPKTNVVPPVAGLTRETEPERVGLGPSLFGTSACRTLPLYGCRTSAASLMDIVTGHRHAGSRLSGIAPALIVAAVFPAVTAARSDGLCPAGKELQQL